MGEAYRAALELQTTLGEEAGHVAADRAERCKSQGDSKGFDYWNRVCAFVTHLNLNDSRTLH